MIFDLVFVVFISCATIAFCGTSSVLCYGVFKDAAKEDSVIASLFLTTSLVIIVSVGMCAVYGACALCGY